MQPRSPQTGFCSCSAERRHLVVSSRPAGRWRLAGPSGVTGQPPPWTSAAAGWAGGSRRAPSCSLPASLTVTRLGETNGLGSHRTSPVTKGPEGSSGPERCRGGQAGPLLSQGRPSPSDPAAPRPSAGSARACGAGGGVAAACIWAPVPVCGPECGQHGLRAPAVTRPGFHGGAPRGLAGTPSAPPRELTGPFSSRALRARGPHRRHHLRCQLPGLHPAAVGAEPVQEHPDDAGPGGRQPCQGRGRAGRRARPRGAARGAGGGDAGRGGRGWPGTGSCSSARTGHAERPRERERPFSSRLGSSWQENRCLWEGNRPHV